MRRRPERPVPPEPSNEQHDERATHDQQEWVADQLVRLVGRRALDRLDVEDPANAEYLRWAAAEAHAALTPAERVELAEEARAFAASVKAELERERMAEREPQATPVRRRRRARALASVASAPEDVQAPAGSRGTTIGVAAGASVGTCTAPWLELAVCAGAGRAIWEEPCERWIAIPPEVPAGEHVALPVRGDSMQPMLHDGDTLLVRIGSACATGDVVVARQPDDGYVVKRVGARGAGGLRLVADNPEYPDVMLPDDPALVVGVVVLRWCPHGQARRASA
jgi:hypothetical protein